MEKPVKMKPVQIGMTIFTTLLIGSMVFGRIFFGPPGFNWTFGSIQILMAVIHFTVMVRTRNWIYIIPTGMYTLWWLTFFPPFSGHPLHDIFATASAVFLVAFSAVLISKKINWRYKEILQLAANPVRDTNDGFTTRPFPAGSADFRREEVIGLARWMKKNVIAFPFIEQDRVVLVIPEYMWVYMLFLKRSYKKESYVTFETSGQVTVRIAQNDYQKYREELTFDRLCESLGDLFKRFIQWYREGNPEKIITLLNSAGREPTDEN